MSAYEKLEQDTELMADYRACRRYRREHMRDVYQFALARKYSLDSVVKMQGLGFHSLWVWLPLFYAFPHHETVLYAIMHFLLVLHWDHWWGQAFAGHQHFSYFSREELKNRYGSEWDRGPEEWTRYE